MGILSRSKELERRPAPPMARAKRSRIGEISTGWVGSLSNGLRSVRKTFWPLPPSYAGTRISYDLTRSLYRNDNKSANLGSGFCRRIVNSVMDFVELPRAASGDEIVDEFLNNCIHDYWASELQQAIRDMTRDGETVIRLRQHSSTDGMVTPDEWESCYLEILPPETVAIYYKQGGYTNEIDVAYVRHLIDVVEEDAKDTGASLRQPIVRQHSIIEEIKAETFRYYDETQGEWLDGLEQVNSWNFVPLVEACNEYDASMQSGQSDYEACLPFIMAFHDVLGQTLLAHKAHSIPKAKLKVNDMMQFIASNWPESFSTDVNGNLDPNTFNGQVTWKGTEILFLDPSEEAEFMEVRSVLGDSKTLLDFLLECIAISSETPKSILMDQSVQDVDEMIPFAKKISRKRKFVAPYIQQLCKMVLRVNFMQPVRVPLAWEDITPAIALQKAQVLEQNVMSGEVLAQRQVISDRTLRETLRSHIPAMRSPQQEAKDAKANLVLPTVSQGSVKGTDAGNSDPTKAPASQGGKN